MLEAVGRPDPRSGRGAQLVFAVPGVGREVVRSRRRRGSPRRRCRPPSPARAERIVQRRDRVAIGCLRARPAGHEEAARTGSTAPRRNTRRPDRFDRNRSAVVGDVGAGHLARAGTRAPADTSRPDLTPMSVCARPRGGSTRVRQARPVGENDDAATNSPSVVFHVTWPCVRTRAPDGADAPSDAPHRSSLPRDIVSMPV